MTRTPSPFERLASDEARTCYRRIEKKMVIQGAWRPEYALGLEHVARACAAYLYAVREYRTLKVSEKALRLYALLLKSSHRQARYALKKWFVALEPPEINAQGEDTLIAALCAPLPKVATPLGCESA